MIATSRRYLVSVSCNCLPTFRNPATAVSYQRISKLRIGSSPSSDSCGTFPRFLNPTSHLPLTLSGDLLAPSVHNVSPLVTEGGEAFPCRARRATALVDDSLAFNTDAIFSVEENT